MNPIRSAALACQNLLLANHRKQRIEDLGREGRAPCHVAFYHRVADSHPNGWTISRDGFKQHIDYFESRFDIVDLAEVQRRVDQADSAEPTVSITFDDGYAENCEFALPLLIQRNLPCTYFVSTKHILDQQPFGHDQTVGMALPVNTPKQIREFSDAGIEMGCHTRTHPDFSKVQDRSTVRDEILIGKQELEQITGREARYFAFPFGLPDQLTQVAIETVVEAGFKGFCSAFGAYNVIGRDSFHIRRFHGDPEMSRLKRWCAFDESKLAVEPEIHFTLPENQHTTSVASLGLPELGNSTFLDNRANASV